MKKIFFAILLFTCSSFLACYEGIIDVNNDNTVYKLRDRGPAGGWIFYINPNWERDGWRYLEAAYVTDWTSSWIFGGSTQTTLNGNTSTAIGSGYANSVAIIKQEGHVSSAASACLDATIDGFNDWYLPSYDELNLMFNNLRAYNVGFFTDNDYYLTSSENNATSAMAMYYSSSSYLVYSGNIDKSTYSNDIRIRPIRSF